VRRVVVTLLLLAGVVPAEPPDGAVAPAARWTGPDGAASGSRCSAALPLLGDVEEAWSLAPGEGNRIETPPCLWDGRGFFLAAGPKGRFLHCFDVRTGRKVASKKVLSNSLLKKLPGAPALHVWDSWILVEQPGRPALGYRLSGRSFTSWWRPAKVEGTLNLTVFENELYLPGPSSPVQRRRPGSSAAEWQAHELADDASLESRRGVRIFSETEYTLGARPAIFGPYVFTLVGYSKKVELSKGLAQRELNAYGFALHVYRRSDGRLLASKDLAEQTGTMPATGDPGSLLVTGSTLCVECPWPVTTQAEETLQRPYLILGWRVQRDKLELDDPVVTKFEVPPAQHPLGTIALFEEPELTWGLLSANGRRWLPLARVGQQPRLFTSKVPPTVVGDIVYFGNFAVDLATREILWRLPVEHATFAAVPTDRMVLVVDDGATLRAFRERRGP